MVSLARKQVPFLLLLMLLAGCIPATIPATVVPELSTPSITITPTHYPTPSATITPKLPTPSATIVPIDYPTLPPIDQRLRDVLGIDVQCPYICLDGINPDVTSAEKAHAMLDVASHASGGGDDVAVSITSKNGLVKSINLSSRSNNIGFTMSDFIELLGDPVEIRIEVFPGREHPVGFYFVYYPSRKLALYVAFFDYLDGPDPMNPISEITLNTEFDDAAFVGLWHQSLYEPEKYPFKRQPWLGFGHINDYLP